MAPSSSAKKVAKLASRGKGKKVRFSGGTTFPVVVASASIAMLGLVTYAKVSMPSDSEGSPTSADSWTMAYEFRVCDRTFQLTGEPGDEDNDASAGELASLEAGTSSDAGFINYHPKIGGNTGRKATLGVFLDLYGVSVNKDRLVIPASQSEDGVTEDVYDVDDSSIFDGTACEGETPEILVRVWDNASRSGDYEDKITDFASQRFSSNGMAWVIAVVPEDDSYEFGLPATASRLEDFTAEAGGTDDAGTDGSVPADTAPADTAATETTGG